MTVEVRELTQSAIIESTMSLEEAEMLERARQAPPEPVKPMLLRNVEAGLEASRAEVQQAIDRGRASREAARRRAIDQEPDAPRRRPVEAVEPEAELAELEERTGTRDASLLQEV